MHFVDESAYAKPSLLEVGNPFIAFAVAVAVSVRLIDHSSLATPLLALAYVTLVPIILTGIFVAAATISTAYRWFTSRVLRNDPWHYIPEPKGPQGTLAAKLFAVLGHIPQLRAADPTQTNLRWAKELNSYVYLYRGFFLQPRVVMSDPKGAMYIMGQQRAYDYPKPRELRRYLVALIGDGLVTSEGDGHRKQRKITAPAFTVAAVRSFIPAFYHHTNRLVTALNREIDATEGPSDRPFLSGQSQYAAKASRHLEPVVDMAYWLGKVTLDMIGEVGFGYDFNNVNLEEPGKQGQLAEAAYTLMRSLETMTLIDFLRAYLASRPGLFWLDKILPAPQRHRNAAAVSEVVERYSNEIIAKKKQAIEEEIAAMGLQAKKGALGKAELDEVIGSTTPQMAATAQLHGGANDTDADADRPRAKDLLHLVMRANMAADLKPSDKLSDDELRGSLTSILMAGHETTATQTIWALWELAARPAVVRKLREEIEDYFGMETTVDYDTLHRMPYLDAVCKETMRFWTPIAMTVRVAQKDDVVPLGKSYPCKAGSGSSTFNHVVVKKGQEVVIPIDVISRSEDVWGPTAGEFIPERWFECNLPTTAKESGMPLHLMTFLVGPRSCVGQRAAIAEFKILLLVLLREFDFERIDEWADNMQPKHNIIVRPIFRGQEEVGVQMPLRIKRAQGARQRSGSLLFSGGVGGPDSPTKPTVNRDPNWTSGRSSPVKTTTLG